MHSVIRYVDVSKAFGSRRVLDGINLEVVRGAVHFVIGPSGAGKSVLIKQLVGLLRPDTGSITFDGIEVSQLSEVELFAIRRRCQMIFQHATLFDALSVLDNVAMPIRKRFGVSRAVSQRRALEALDLVHAADLGRKLPVQLGAGVQKRIAIARAIALQPEALLYDEPTTSLDPVAARRTDRLMRRLADELQLTSLVVTHDLASVRAIGDRVTFLHGGRVHFEGSPAQLFACTDPAVCAFVHREPPAAP